MIDKCSNFCDQLNTTITFFHDKVISCCTHYGSPTYYSKYDKENIDFSFISEKKVEFLSNLLNGIETEYECKKCPYLRKSTQEDKISLQFSYINISHWTHCNCGCIYCARHNNSYFKIETKTKKSQYYDFLPILKEMYKKNLIDKENVTFCFQGGDISVLKEFKDILKCIRDYGYKNIQILTNNIIYHPDLKKIINENNNHIMITASLDSGTRETYKKIKRVDKFNDFISNLKKYVKGIPYPNIKIKYLLVKNYNDNEQELKTFINLMSKIGIKQVELDIDFSIIAEVNKNSSELPKHYKNLYLLFIQLCKEHNLTYYIQQHNIEFFLM